MFYADYTGNLTLAGVLTAAGDIVYNSGKSLISQIGTLNGYKTSGSLSATTSFKTAYTLTTSSRGFIAVNAVGNPYGMVKAYFEYLNGSSNPTLTQLAFSGGGAATYPLAANVPNTAAMGTQNIFLRLSSNNLPTSIQVKVTSAQTVSWSITFI